MKTMDESRTKFIKRETAQRALCADCFWNGRCREACRDYKRLDALPTEEVEPIRYASWEIQEDGSVRCSSCGLIIHSAFEGAGNAEKQNVLPRRCENCGARIVFELKKEDGNATD